MYVFSEKWWVHVVSLFKLFEPMTPPPGWKCLKWFKLRLGEPWEGEGSDDNEIDTDEVVLHKETTEMRKETTEMRMESTEMCKNHAEMRKNCNDETKHQRTNWNDETLLDETDTFLLLASQKFQDEYACNNDDAKIGESEKDTIDDEMLLYLTQQFESVNDGKLESSGVANVRYGSPKTTEKVVEARKSGITGPK